MCVLTVFALFLCICLVSYFVPVPLPLGVMCWSLICDRGISWYRVNLTAFESLAP